METRIKGKTKENGCRPHPPLRGGAVVLMVVAAAVTLACVHRAEVWNPAGDAGSPTASSPQPAISPTPAIAAEEPEMDAENWFAGRVDDIGKHAAIVASLQPGRTLARLNADAPFNPASLVKLATSLTALKKLGPGYRFEVSVHANGVLQENGTFDGDLYLSGRSPSFDQASAELIRDELRERGVEKITGRLHVSPGFSYRYIEQTESSAELLSKHLFPGRPPATSIAGQPSGKEIFVLRSQPLDQILLYQNTFSSNVMAHRVGDAVGGPEGVRRYLIQELGLSPGAVRLETTSGLGENAMTARDIFAVLRELDKELARHGLEPHDILPVADENRSTLKRRLGDSPFATAVTGKTGTLSAADGGVGMASLAGYIRTNSGEALAFVLIDEGPSFRRHAEMQEEFLFDVLAGRIAPTPVEFERPRELLPRSALEIEVRGALLRAQKL